jgi:hypothetical protein
MGSKASANGAVAGALAAGIWAAQQPLDKRAFNCRYDDVELLGKLFGGRGNWVVIGTAMHLINGAAFGAGFGFVEQRLPGPRVGKALSLALAENFLLWPLGRITDRHHPAKAELVRLRANRRAFWQSTWRHVVFGFFLGAIEHYLDRSASTHEVPVASDGYKRSEPYGLAT